MPKGFGEFCAFFTEHYPDGRFDRVLAAMEKEPPKVGLWNRHCQLVFEEVCAELDLVDIMPSINPKGCLRLLRSRNPKESVPQPLRDDEGTCCYYILDLASALATEALGVEAWYKVLDMCAAPGGKSVGLGQFLSGPGELDVIEATTDRFQRLERTLRDYFPTNTVNTRAWRKDATRWHHPEHYDRVLIDAPCSSERHLLRSADQLQLQRWRPAVTMAHAKAQVLLVLRGLETLKEGGRLLYCTCSISPLENDGVIAEALKKTRCGVKSVATPFPEGLGEATDYGLIVLPDKTSDGWGPLFMATLEKVSERKALSDDESSEEEEEEEESE